MIVKGSGYVRGNREAARARLVSHLKYVEHRSRELSQESRDDRRIFDKHQDVVNRRDAVNDVMSHTSTSVNYHKLVLSPSEEEPVQDWREWTRAVMADLEKAQGKELHWYAVHHHNTDHPHVHVVVAGSGYHQQREREEPVKLYTADYDLLRHSGREHSDYHFRCFLQEQLKELDTLDRTVDQSPLDRQLEAHQPERVPPSPSLEDFDR